ncbi:hypothetical protein M0802_009104 [Mischocyttarus mexicanus]|nr:hypothetical protein M0802_009104 [Mischocyttarus mexicanus]
MENQIYDHRKLDKNIQNHNKINIELCSDIRAMQEIRTDTKKTKKKMNNIEMRVLRTILGLALRDRQTNSSMR